MRAARPTVVLDLGGVVLANAVRRMLEAVAADAGASPAATYEDFESRLRGPMWTGQVTEPAFWGELSAVVGAPVDGDRWRTWLGAELVPLHPGIDRRLAGWAERSTLLALSNHRSEWMVPALARTGLDTAFAEVFVTDRLGVAKPDPEALAVVLARHGTQAADAILVDDVEENVVAAREIGADGLLADPDGRWMDELDRWIAR